MLFGTGRGSQMNKIAGGYFNKHFDKDRIPGDEMG